MELSTYYHMIDFKKSSIYSRSLLFSSLKLDFHCWSKHHETNSMQLYSSKAFQWYQKCNKRHCVLRGLNMTIKQTNKITFLHKRIGNLMVWILNLQLKVFYTLEKWFKMFIPHLKWQKFTLSSISYHHCKLDNSKLEFV